MQKEHKMPYPTNIEKNNYEHCDIEIFSTATNMNTSRIEMGENQK